MYFLAFDKGPKCTSVSWDYHLGIQWNHNFVARGFQIAG